LQWVSALADHSPKLQQVRGPAFFEQAIDAGRAAGLRHYLLGSTVEVLEKLTQNLHDRYPGAEIVGAESPPFRPLSEAECREQDARILASGANIVWVGLGTPKQDFEARRLAQSIPVVALAIGAAFDFSAGTLNEAPKWMRAVGLEWAFRLIKEPRRLWRRYLIGNVRFIRVVAADALAQRKNAGA
jgi:N-acetylglucosaminyldiphosphoundecaprenol N-acetyl-beta-D-mannosaminyltransferase